MHGVCACVKTCKTAVATEASAPVYLHPLIKIKFFSPPRNCQYSGVKLLFIHETPVNL